jgi:YbbR domain-containing protein
VEIVGPETAVKRARDAMTETISVADLRESAIAEVTIGLIDPALRLKTPRTVTVTLPILPGPVERTVRNRPIHLRNLGSHLSAQAMPVVVDVGLRGSREALSGMDADAVTAFIDVVGLGPGTYMLGVHADAEQAGVTHIDPATVEVRITSAKD